MQISVFTPKDRFGSNTYLVSEGDSFAVIDASVPLSELIGKVPECAGKIAFLLLTHAHFDHILALRSYHDSKIPIFLREEDRPMLADPFLNCSFGEKIAYDFPTLPLTDGQTIPFGTSAFSVKASPGHTKGSAVFQIGEYLFTGDTLFAGGSYGRCDLPEGNFTALKASLGSLSEYPEDLTVLSGHGDGDRLGRTLSLLFS